MTKFLITQNKDEIINISKITSIRVNGNSIVADVLCSIKEIGVYESKDDAEREFNRIMNEMVNGFKIIWLN
jgi:hypothetical protein